MKNNFFIKKYADNISEELNNIGFDLSYLNFAKSKYKFLNLTIFNLTCVQANLLKQTCLSCGFDCAINKNCLVNKVEFSNAFMVVSKSQIMTLAEKLKKQQFSMPNLAEMLENSINSIKNSINIKSFEFKNDMSYLVGILNLTPDSFSDGGTNLDLNVAYKNFILMKDKGAKIIDIGAESTRPNAISIDEDEEIKRLLPFLNKLKEKNENNIISVDTQNAKTARLALELGANIINDVSFLNDEKMIDVLLEFLPYYVLTHNSRNIKSEKNGSALIDEFLFQIKEKIDFLIKSGFPENKIILDVGLGFKNKKEDNILLLKNIDCFKSFNLPLFIGVSRKSFLNAENLEDADFKTSILTSFLAKKGINFIRVHNVGLNKKALDTNLIF